MRFPTIILATICILVFSQVALAVFPARPLTDAEGNPIPNARFIEEPRMIDGKRYMPQPTETIVVILVEFPADTVDSANTAIADTAAAVTFQPGHDSAYFYDHIFDEQQGSNSMDQYWDECSLGQMDITGDVYGPFTLPHCIKYYGWDTQGCPSGTVIDDGWSDDGGRTDCQLCSPGGAGTGSCRLIADAVEVADSVIDFTQYDTDNDGNVDHVIVVHAGKGQEMGSGAASWNIWSWFYGNLAYATKDTVEGATQGVIVSSGMIVPEFYAEPDSFPLGVFCHEFSHSIGNPDLYDINPGAANVPDDDDYPVADWGLMAHGSWCGPTGMGERPSHLLGFNKIGTGWITPTVLKPQKDTTSYSVIELEGPGATMFRIDVGKSEYFLLENRNSHSQNASFDKLDSDWSDWTGHGGPDSLDCGLIITHVIGVHDITLRNNGRCSYDYVTGDGCTCSPIPYEVWVEDPGYNDSLTVDYDEWWYPWEIKAGAAYAADDPHAVFDTLWHNNANCTRTASSIDVSGKVTGIYVKATSNCGRTMNVDVFIPGWTPPKLVPVVGKFCLEWGLFHHDRYSQGWTNFGPILNINAPYNDRLRLDWRVAGETAMRSSPVVVSASIVVAPGDTVKSLAFVAASSGSLYCYDAADGRRIWATELGTDLHTTPIACDTIYALDGAYEILNRIYTNGSDARLYALDLETGVVEDSWQEPRMQPLEAEPRIAMIPDPGAPGAYRTFIYVGSMGGDMYAVDAQTMTAEWDMPAGAPINCPATIGSIEMPSLKGDVPGGMLQQTMRMDVVFFGDASGGVHCVDALTGAPVWDVNLGMEVLASPVVCDSVTQAGVTGYSDQILVVATMDGTVYALDAATGMQLWSYAAGEAIASSPSVAVDHVHNWGMIWFQTTSGTVYCLHLGDPPGGNRLIWSYSNPDGGSGSSPGVVLPYGSLPIGFDEVGDPIYPPACATGDPEDDGVVYIAMPTGGGAGGGIYALDAADGTVLWHYTFPGLTDASPAPTMGKLYVTADALYAFSPDTLAGIWAGDVTPVLRLEVSPNPVGSRMAISYSVPVKCGVELKVYDVRGRLVKTIFAGKRLPGSYSATWDGRNVLGEEVADGIYFMRLTAGRDNISKKVVKLD